MSARPGPRGGYRVSGIPAAILMPETYTSSTVLRNWCERNRNRFYIPEWLLDQWGIIVDADLSGAA